MPDAQRLTLLFAAILTQVTGLGCPVLGSCPDSDDQILPVLPDALVKAMADGMLSADECYALCDGPGTTGDATDGTTTDATTTGSETTGDATTTDAMTTDATTDATTSGSTTDATTDATTTGTSTSTSSTTAVEDSATGGNPDLLGCAAIEGDPNHITCTYRVYCVGGRRPAGLASEGRATGDDACARYFAEVAHLEAASVPAFERLAAELADHGAPAELINAAQAAAIDEARHAVLVGALAARHGGAPSPVELHPISRRTLIEIAVDNAVEGCVGETWAALVAAHQARVADDPEVRRCMAEIAADEAAHAALAWAIDAWIRPRLGAEGAAEVDAARARAALALRDPPALDHALVRNAGLPDDDRTRRLWAALDRGLWSAAA